MGSAAAVLATLWAADRCCHRQSERGAAAASDRPSSTSCPWGRTEEARSLPRLSIRAGPAGRRKSPSEPGQQWSQHLGFQPSDLLDHKINVNNWVKVQGPVKETVAHKLRDEGPEHGHKKPLCGHFPEMAPHPLRHSPGKGRDASEVGSGPPFSRQAASLRCSGPRPFPESGLPAFTSRAQPVGCVLRALAPGRHPGPHGQGGISRRAQPPRHPRHHRLARSTFNIRVSLLGCRPSEDTLSSFLSFCLF